MSDLKELFKTNLLKSMRDEQALLKSQMRAISAKERAGARELSGAEADKLWAEVDDAGTKLIASGQQGYDSWVASMSQIGVQCKKFSEALSASDPVGSLLNIPFEWIIVPIGQALYDLPGLIWSKTFASDQDVEMPSIQIPLEMSNDNKLDLSPDNLAKFVFRSDGKPASTAELNLMANGITAWLTTNGVTEQPPESGVYIKDNVRVDKAQFLELRDDAANGLLREFWLWLRTVLTNLQRNL